MTSAQARGFAGIGIGIGIDRPTARERRAGPCRRPRPVGRIPGQMLTGRQTRAATSWSPGIPAMSGA